ncbi:MAG: glycosyltransferase [Eikenella sp.]|nr:glycosyltransferase [Eikenella sp.]
MNKNKLSICCLGYQHAAFLQECLASIAQIPYTDIEVVVVDDGSPDNSVEVLSKLAQSFPFPLKIIAQENTGNIGKNFNQALLHTTGELVSFIALDDVFHPKSIVTAIEYMNADSRLAFIAPAKAVAISQEGWILDTLPPLPIESMKHPNINTLLECEYTQFGSFYIQGCLFRKSVIEAVGGFDEDMTGDDIVLRTKLFRYIQAHPEWQYGFLPLNSVFYRLHDNNIHKNGIRQIRIVTEYLSRYWPDRPNPPMLTNWALGTLNEGNPVEWRTALQHMNSRAADLLNDQQIRRKMKKLAYRQTRWAQASDDLLKRFVFRKEKPSPNERKIVLFGFIRFTYRKSKSQSQADKPPVHYSTFF